MRSRLAILAWIHRVVWCLVAMGVFGGAARSDCACVGVGGGGRGFNGVRRGVFWQGKIAGVGARCVMVSEFGGRRLGRCG